MWNERMNNIPGWYDESIPPWLNPEFESRLRLRERWAELKTEGSSPHPVRPKSYASFTCDFPTCGGGNNAFGGVALEERHPLGDLRLVRFLLAVPAIPWCREKHLIRTALKGILPEAVRLRPKAPVPGFPYFELARRSRRPELPTLRELHRYVDFSKLPKWPGKDREELDYALRFLRLHYWLLGL
jgi:asparagine synthase (glutamine-hydrolysing)